MDIGCGARLSAHCYFAADTRPGLLPYGWYLEHVLIDAGGAGLPACYVAQVAAIDCAVDPDPQRHARELSIYATQGVQIDDT